jgi:membrane associated rhomboid family serine protease
VSDKEQDSFSMSTFWKTNLPTRNILVILLVIHLVLWIISLATVDIVTFRDAISISQVILIRIGQFNLAVFQGHVYQLITSIFVHVDLLHVLSNCLFLLVFGLKAEERLLSWQYYFVFVLSGLMGGILSFVYGPISISAGASGAIFGLLGADLVLMYQHERTKSFWGYAASGVIFFLIMSFGNPNVNLFAHAIGLVTGAIVPFIFKKRRQPDKIDNSVRKIQKVS